MLNSLQNQNSVGYYDTDKEGEEACYRILKDNVIPLLELVKNNKMEDFVKLNRNGVSIHPSLKGQVFRMKQLEQFIFQTGVNPFEFTKSK